ncbi:hypothetical protein AC578_2641 [Pseudocercospora eumusae]|uniref:Uncharacterized protein n=1 Tax=Pseudocercospora eumusae TaxID=321146 RepID=A0A139H0E3_9PEZI|nr:hypothetical protein AC578_2641 [Pseudocercospora eumusae]
MREFYSTPMHYAIRSARPHGRLKYQTLLKPNAGLHTDAQRALDDGAPVKPASSQHDRRHPLDQVRVSPDQPTILGDNALMDPIYLEARHKYKQTKADAARNHDELTPFQRKLALDPHAHALASSIRQCRLTQVRLPYHFLATFQLAARKSSLVDDDDTVAERGQPEDTSHKASPRFTPHTGHKGRVKNNTYVLGTRAALEHISQKTNWKMLVPEKQRDQQWEWDKNMPDRYLQSLRNTALKQLRICLKTQDTTNHENSGCVLFTCEREESLDAMSAHTTGNAQPAPYEYDLRKLFPPEQVVTFISEHDIKDEKIVLSRHTETTIAVMCLEKLQDYIR